MIDYAKAYAESVGLRLESSAVDCWDNPISAGAHCSYPERAIQSRLNRYARDEDITDVWIWAEARSDGEVRPVYRLCLKTKYLPRNAPRNTVRFFISGGYSMKTQKFKRTLSLFLAMLMCVTTLFGMGTTAFAAEETDEVYLISYPRDGDANYGGEWGTTA